MTFVERIERSVERIYMIVAKVYSGPHHFLIFVYLIVREIFTT